MDGGVHNIPITFFRSVGINITTREKIKNIKPYLRNKYILFKTFYIMLPNYNKLAFTQGICHIKNDIVLHKPHKVKGGLNA